MRVWDQAISMLFQPWETVSGLMAVLWELAQCWHQPLGIGGMLALWESDKID